MFNLLLVGFFFDEKFNLFQLCRALAYIHGGFGICHRDIKPQNLLVFFSL